MAGGNFGNKTVRQQDISAPVEKDSSAPRYFGPHPFYQYGLHTL
jgi:hypothetical protein